MWRRVTMATLVTSSSMDDTVFVERNAHDVYRDYIGITGTPSKSEPPRVQWRVRCVSSAAAEVGFWAA